MQWIKDIAVITLFFKRFLCLHEKKWFIKICTVIGAMIVSTVMNVLGPLLFREIINRISLKENSTLVMTMLVGYGILWLLSNLSSQLRSFIVGNLIEEIVSHFSVVLFDHLQALSLRFHLERKSGAISNTFMRACQGIESLFWGLLLFMIPTLVELVLAIGVIIYFYGLLYGAVIGGILIAYCTVSILGLEKSHKAQERHNEKRSAAQAYMLDSFLNYETIKHFSQQLREHETCKKVTGEQMAAAQQSNSEIMKIQALQSCIVGFGLVGLMLFAGRSVTAGTLNASDFVLINSYILQFVMPLSYIGHILQQIRKGYVDVKEAIALLQRQPEIVDTPHAMDIPLEPISITFDSVSFHYDKKREILQDISFSVPAGKTIAIVGPTGSGKSTIARLLFRMYDVDGGAIVINGHDIRSLTQKSLHKLIGVVSQDTILFNNTLYYNIAYGNFLASRKEILDTIVQVELNSFIAQLPEGLETIVGERGLLLSGGEKQRVALARALLKKPMVYIFDEATSALDMQTERKIMRNVRLGPAAKIIIAHRLNAIVGADEILVMSGGKIVERGTHSYLLSLSGLYESLWNEQEPKSHVFMPENNVFFERRSK